MENNPSAALCKFNGPATQETQLAHQKTWNIQKTKKHEEQVLQYQDLKEQLNKIDSDLKNSWNQQKAWEEEMEALKQALAKEQGHVDLKQKIDELKLNIKDAQESCHLWMSQFKGINSKISTLTGTDLKGVHIEETEKAHGWASTTSLAAIENVLDAPVLLPEHTLTTLTMPPGTAAASSTTTLSSNVQSITESATTAFSTTLLFNNAWPIPEMATTADIFAFADSECWSGIEVETADIVITWRLESGGEESSVWSSVSELSTYHFSYQHNNIGASSA